MDVGTIKIVAFIATLLVGLAGGLISLSMAKTSQSERFFSLGSAFSGGIFLGAGLIHMLPDAQEGFHSITDSDFPWVPLICCLGFLLILGLERVVIRGHHSIIDSALDSSRPGNIYPYVLTLVLSVHSIIAGIALGTEETISQAVIIIIAILAHKGSAGFALGVSLCREHIAKVKIVKIIGFFSFMTPLGILLGAFLTAMMTGRTETIVAAVFDAVAAGTFLYVAIMGVIEEEFSKHQDRLLKLVLLSFGLGLMAVLAVWL